MFKAPSKHGLDRKFKPWRKGKSANSKNRSSLKKQLRGYERVLQKKKSEGDQDNVKELEQKIEALKQEIAQKQQSLSEKKHAEKAHGQRFMDRQRLSRMEKQVRKQQNSDEQLFPIALDQVYVAHHPMDVKYMPLFKRGQRVVEYSRALYRRAMTRKRILKQLSTQDRVPWIAPDMYERLLTKPLEWSIQEEERVFGGSIARKGKAATKSQASDDVRFATASQHEALLKAADQIESELLIQEENDTEKNPSAKQESSDDSSSSSSSSDSDSDDDDDVKVNPLNISLEKKNVEPSDELDSSSDSSSDDDDDDDESLKQGTKRPLENSSNDPPRQKQPPSNQGNQGFNNQGGKHEEDDFLVDATNDEDHDKSLFQKAGAQELPAWSSSRGDKSKGWQTQKQRPGEFKRRKKTWR
jgi:uncharacterized small protein (DUF1192 family)